MEITVLIFLTSGLFLGWALGANDAANVFGTAVGTRMVSFGTAAIVCSVFVILGAVVSGAGTTETLGQLGAINSLAGSFMAALSAACSVYFMTKIMLPLFWKKLKMKFGQTQLNFVNLMMKQVYNYVYEMKNENEINLKENN